MKLLKRIFLGILMGAMFFPIQTRSETLDKPQFYQAYAYYEGPNLGNVQFNPEAIRSFQVYQCGVEATECLENNDDYEACAREHAECVDEVYEEQNCQIVGDVYGDTFRKGCQQVHGGNDERMAACTILGYTKGKRLQEWCEATRDPYDYGDRVMSVR